MIEGANASGDPKIGLRMSVLDDLWHSSLAMGAWIRGSENRGNNRPKGEGVGEWLAG